MSNIEFVNDEQLRQLIDSTTHQPLDTSTVIIDVRGADEYAREHINGSQRIDIAALKQCQTLKDKTVIFHCQAGVRTRQTQAELNELPCQKAYCLEGGINQWKHCGFKTELNSKAPLPIMRQVQIIAGSLVSIGAILGLWLSPYFVLLSLFVGLGLIFAGVSGFCGMAKLLTCLPYNRNN